MALCVRCLKYLVIYIRSIFVKITKKCIPGKFDGAARSWTGSCMGVSVVTYVFSTNVIGINVVFIFAGLWTKTQFLIDIRLIQSKF